MANIGDKVLVRTFSAGVHFGTIQEKSVDAKRVVLSDTRRIWSWSGANSLNEIATTGLDIDRSRVSAPVGTNELTEAIELLTVTPQAASILEAAKWSA